MAPFTTRNWVPGFGNALDVVIARSNTALAFILMSVPILHAQSTQNMNSPSDTLTLGAGCFWCVEAVFESLTGVVSAESGYMGGAIKNPSYREVCTGRTGHAEVVRVIYEPDIISIQTLLEVFFETHDPTTLNRQGADVGTQYRSAIFFHTEPQRLAAVAAIQKHQESVARPIVTEITQASAFYRAEDYHQAYYELNGEAPYCKAVILPKMQKLNAKFQPLLKHR